MKFSAACSLVLLFLLAGLPAVQAQPPFLVRDINTAQAPLQLWDDRDEMAAVGNQLFFVWDDGIHGNELWESDGPSAAPRLVRDICPGACSASPKALTAAQGKLFFIADDGAHGRELWRSDGTEAGTSLAWDFDATPKDSLVSLTYAGATRMMALVDFGDSGQELDLTDGTMDGTHAIAFSYPGPEQPAARVLAYSPSGLVLYAANNSVNGVEPSVFDKVAFHSTPLADIYPGGGSSLHTSYSPSSIAGADAIAAPWGGFLFSADDSVDGRELWITDGTPAGTRLLKDLYAGSFSSIPHGLTVLNGAVYFAATGPQGPGLWRTDGTAAGTTLVKSLGASSSGPLEITAVGNLLFFLADDPAHGEPLRLFRSDGTEAGTFPLPGASGPLLFGFQGGHHGLSAVNGQLLLLADDGTGGSVWKSDGTPAGTVRAATVGSYASVLMEDGYAVAGGNLYLHGGQRGEEIWRSDGTAAGTARVQSGPSSTSSFLLFGAEPYSREAFAALGGEIYFSAYDGTASGQLWKSDGAAAGTVKLETNAADPEQFRVVNSRLVFNDGRIWATDGTPGTAQTLLPGISPVFNLAVAGSTLFYTAYDPTTGDVELFKTDGTPEGTDIVSSLAVGVTTSNPQFLTPVGGTLFFQATDEAGTELWTSDGTGPGTARLADVQPGDGSSSPRNLTADGGTLFFSAAAGGAGRELWKSDGTAAGTVLVKDIQPLSGSSIPGSGTEGTFAAAAGGQLFFVANDGQTGEELWKSDGTTAGTVLVQNISFETLGSYPRHLTAVGPRVYFVAGPFSDRELWVSDGTGAGTHRVKDINPGPESSRPGNLTAMGSVLLFSAFDPAHGVEAWRTDGTAVGTRRVTDIAPGPLSSSPFGFTAAGANLYFSANDNTTGFELWAVPQSNVLATFEDVPTTYWAWRSIEAVAAAGITLGCGEGLFCTERTLTRAEMGVFLGRGLHGSAFVPPPAIGTRFTDVPASYWAADWIEQIATDGVTQGCATSPARFCPAAQVARAEMAIFLLRARHGAAYMPPPATGTRFTDVPAGFWAAAWIEQLAAEGITNGCGVNLYCPNKTVGRAEMAVFLTRAFNLAVP